MNRYKKQKGLMMSGESDSDDIIEKLLGEVGSDLNNIPNRAKDTIREIQQKLFPKSEEKSTFEQLSNNYSTHKVFKSVLNDVKLNIPVMLVGPAGSGKSTLLNQIAEKSNLQYYPMSVNGQTAEYHIIGYKNANGDYIGTTFRDAYEKGGLFSFEEIDAGNPNVLTVINNALSQDFYLFPDKIVQKHEQFRLCASANTYGYGATRQYVGRNPLDAATLDRFAVTSVDYDENLEIQIGPVKEWTLFVQALRSIVPNWDGRIPPIVISTRAVVLGGRDVKSGTNWNDVLNKFVWRGAFQQADINNMKQDAFQLFIQRYAEYIQTR